MRTVITATDIAIMLAVLALLAIAGFVYYAATKARRNKMRDWETASYTDEELEEALKRDKEKNEK